jgi:hypothetical protein
MRLMTNRVFRRDLPKVLLASAMGPAVAQEAPAAASTRAEPAWSRTAVEARLEVRPRDLRYPVGHVLRYGARGDWDGRSGTDNTAAFRAALAVSHETGHTLFVPAGRYLITAPLQKWQSFQCPNIRGEGFGSTRIVYPDFGSDAALFIQGGSGRLCGATIEGIGFEGSRRSCAIEVDGQDGLILRDCGFLTNAVGVRLHNRSRGAFTEYVVAENCHFDGACARALEFRVSEGHNSFNGCGLRHCTIVLDERHDAPIRIGPGALPYNAPLSAQVWTYGTGKTVIRNDAARPALFHGTLTLEAFGRFEKREQCPTLARGQPVHLVGGLLGTGPVNFGSAQLGSRAGLLGPESGKANGQTLIRRHPWSLRAGLTRGATRVAYVGDESSQLVYVELSGERYDYRCMLVAAHHGRGGRGFVHTLARLSELDEAGYGAPIFEIDAGGMLIIRNPRFPPKGVVAFLDFVPLGLSRTAYLDSAVEHVTG